MINSKERKVMALIEEQRSGLVQSLQQLIHFKTITPDNNAKAESDDYQRLQSYVQQTLLRMGFETDMWEIDTTVLPRFPGSGVKENRDLSNMPVVTAQHPGIGGGKSLLLNGHYDVVPVGEMECWQHNPFAGTVENNRIYGRGAVDMKGGIAAMLQAIGCIQQAGIELKGDLLMATVPDEEASCMGTLACCKKGIHADAAIIPEPTCMDVLVAMRGSLYGKIIVPGRAGHAELPQPDWQEGGAVNAIDKSRIILDALAQLNETWQQDPTKQHKYLSPDTINPTMISGGEWRVTFPEKVEIDFSCVFVPGAMNKIKEIKQKIEQAIKNDSWLKENPPLIQTTPWLYGAEVDESEIIVQIGLNSLKDLGKHPMCRGFGSLTDGVHLINYAKIPTISIGPNDHTAHMADEYVDIDELVMTAKLMALCIMRWCEY